MNSKRQTLMEERAVELLIFGALLVAGCVWTIIILVLSDDLARDLPVFLGPIAFIAIGAYGLQRQRQAMQAELALEQAILDHGLETTATIALMNRNYLMTNRARPVVSMELLFTDPQGVEHMVRRLTLPDDKVQKRGLKAGDHIKIKYLPDNPKHALIPSLES